MAQQISKAHQAVYDAVMAKAEQLRTNAGYNGAHNDGGAGQLGALADAWRAGLQGKVPKRLKEYAEQVRQEADPEWSEYVRLRSKFGR